MQRFWVVALVLGMASWGSHASAAPTCAAQDDGFFVLDDGLDLKPLDDNDYLYRRTGCGNVLGSSQERLYFQLKNDARVRWVVRDLETGEVIAPVDGPALERARENRYGASIQKVLVVAALLWRQDGVLTEGQWRDAIMLIPPSKNNPYWDNLEDAAGGRTGMEEFAVAMGYSDIGPWRHSTDGGGNNSLNPMTMTQFLYDLHHDRIPGSQSLLTLMAASKTGLSRAQKYTPTEVFLGGKTGSLASTATNNELRYIDVDGRRYAIAVFTELGAGSGSTGYEGVAVMFGGLLQEYILGGGSSTGDGIGGGDELGPPPDSAGGCTAVSGPGASPWLLLGVVIVFGRRRRRPEGRR